MFAVAVVGAAIVQTAIADHQQKEEKKSGKRAGASIFLLFAPNPRSCISFASFFRKYIKNRKKQHQTRELKKSSKNVTHF